MILGDMRLETIFWREAEKALDWPLVVHTHIDINTHSSFVSVVLVLIWVAGKLAWLNSSNSAGNS